MTHSANGVWTLIPYHRGPSTLHFALSDYLVRNVDRPTVWAHSADRPALILGAGQRVEQLDLPSAAAAGIAIVTRQAGGTTVYANSDVLGVDVAVPSGHALAGRDVVEAYRWLGEVWNDAAHLLGVDSRLVGIEEARSAPRDPELEDVLRLACFGSVSPFEVAVGSRKLVGLAQVRRRGGVLWQSGIHLHFDAGRLASLLPHGARSVLQTRLRERAIGLDEAAPVRHSLQDVLEVFLTALAHRQGVRFVTGAWSEELLSRAGIDTSGLQ